MIPAVFVKTIIRCTCPSCRKVWQETLNDYCIERMAFGGSVRTKCPQCSYEDEIDLRLIKK